MIDRKCIRLVCAAAVLAGVAGCATRGDSPATAEETVRRFCELDFEGARLSSDTDYRVKPLVAWSRTPDTDPVYLISAFEVVDSETTGDRARVTVRYDVINVMGVTWKAPEAPNPAIRMDGDGNRTVDFTLEKQRGAWRIVAPELTPHASPKALAQAIRKWPQAGRRNNDSRLNETLRYLDSLQ